ncbi:MAG: type II secretion system F family protein [Phascolarctobacterium sp.]|nr:type II secretion system F family protein [Candidatus Phascolarctobacterium caballi]
MYQYRTIDDKGHRESGIVNIDDYAQAVEYVRNNYGMILQLQEIKNKPALSGDNYTDKQRTYFFKQLGTILQSGITILEGLAIIAESKDKKIAHICKQLSVRIANGLSVSHAMSELPEFFTDLCITLVRAGEESGELPNIAKQIAEYYYKKDKLGSYIERAAIYPMVVLVAGIGVLLLFLFVVLPNVGNVYATLRAPQGGMLSGLLLLQKFLTEWWYVVAGIILLLAYFVLQKRNLLLHLILRLPMLKELYKEVLEIRFCKLLALLLNSGISIIEAIGSAALAVDDEHYYMELQRLKMALSRGEDLTTVLEQENTFFSPVVKGFMVVGSRTGNLPQLLSDAAALREEVFEAKLERSKEFLSPILLLVVALFIGVIVISIMQPIFNLFEALPMY